MDGNRCRHCHNEIETLAHVLGSCSHGEALRNARHHKVRTIIAQALRDVGFRAYEEIHGLSESGSTRRIDILAFKDERMGYIIDPTIRLEYCKSQPDDVHKEKVDIYGPTIPYFSAHYNLENIQVIGLLVGARGTITSKFAKFIDEFNLHPSLLKTISITALKYSVYILRHHIYMK